MSRASMITLGVIVLAVIVAIGYYSTNQPTGKLSAQCVERFNGLDAANKDTQLAYNEFLAYRGGGVTTEDFAKADQDKNNALTVQEFCTWTAAEETG